MHKTSKWIVAFAAMAIITAATAGPSLAGGARYHGGQHVTQSKHNTVVTRRYVPARPQGWQRHGAAAYRRPIPQWHGRNYRFARPPIYTYRRQWTPPGHRQHQPHYGGFGLVYRFRR